MKHRRGPSDLHARRPTAERGAAPRDPGSLGLGLDGDLARTKCFLLSSRNCRVHLESSKWEAAFRRSPWEPGRARSPQPNTCSCPAGCPAGQQVQHGTWASPRCCPITPSVPFLTQTVKLVLSSVSWGHPPPPSSISLSCRVLFLARSSITWKQTTKVGAAPQVPGCEEGRAGGVTLSFSNAQSISIY